MASSSLVSPVRRVCQFGLRAALARVPSAAASGSGGPVSTLSLHIEGVLPISNWMPNPVWPMELGVPKSKITRSRKGKRNGPKFLKPVSVIARCTVCGRVKLPQFFCCNGTTQETLAEKE